MPFARYAFTMSSQRSFPHHSLTAEVEVNSDAFSDAPINLAGMGVVEFMLFVRCKRMGRILWRDAIAGHDANPKISFLPRFATMMSPGWISWTKSKPVTNHLHPLSSVDLLEQVL
jgi:hypothetical protein